MQSIKNIYKIGYGPSSSHTMGPSYAALDFIGRYSEADRVVATLYGSLAKTGKGHGTDRAVLDTLSGYNTEVKWDMDSPTPVHPNTVDFAAYKGGELLGSRRYYSIGGGEIRTDDSADKEVAGIPS